MNIRNSLRLLSIVSILLLSTLSAAHLGTLLSGSRSPIFDIHPAGGSFEAGVTVLGIDCGLGSNEAVDIDFDGAPEGDLALNTTCTWIVTGGIDGDIDGDGVRDPLVSDIPSLFPPGTPGGFTAEVRVIDAPANFNGFDITLSYDTTNLECVRLDQIGPDTTGDGVRDPLPFSGSFELARVCGGGTVRLAQVLLGTPLVAGSYTLFNIRFDVIGKSLEPLTFVSHTLTNPGAVAHKAQDATFDSRTALGWNISWTVSPNPPVPGQPATYTATASCAGCTGALKFDWDFNSDTVIDASGNPVTITAPPPVVNRVELTVTDQVGNSNIAVRRLALNVAVTGPSTLAVNTPGTWTGLWNGGTPSYTGAWRFCPGTLVTANAVCARPAPTIAAAAGADQIDAQTLSAAPGPGAYHFAGIYTDTLRITDGAATIMTVTFLVTVTGTPQAYTVTLSNPAKANIGDTVTVSATMTYAATYLPTSFRSSSFDVTFSWGDASSTTVSVSGCDTAEPPATPCTVSSTHVYNAGGTYTIGATAKETAPAAVSKIQEVGTSTIQVNVPVAFDYSLSVNPTSGKVTAGGSTSATVTATLLTASSETVILSASGAPAGASVSFSPPDGLPTFPSTMTITTSKSTTPPGTYPMTITGTSTSGVVRTTSFTLTVNPAPPPAITVSCPSGTAGKAITCTASGSGGTPPYSAISWSAPSGSPSTGTGSSFTTTFSVKGSYSVTGSLTDANGDSASQTVTVVITAQELMVTVSCPDTGLTAGKPFTCTVSATGGTLPYEGTGDQTVSFAVKGTYTVTLDVTDANGVTASGSDTVVIAPQALTVTVSCPDSGLTAGKAFTCDVSASGGTPPYTGTGSQTASFAVEGEYTVTFTVADANGVSASGSDTVVIAPQPPEVLVVTVSCPDTGLTAGKPFNCDVSATGGTPPYTGTGSRTASFAVKGTHTVTFTVTDANGNSASGSDTVVIAPQPLMVTVDCPNSGLTAGKPFDCTVAASGGTGPYTGTGTITRSFAVKGTYTVTATVTDANGDSADGSDTVVIAPQALMVTVSCPDSGLTAGKQFTCSVSASGGTAPYTGTGSIEVTIAVEGTHTVTLTVTDANGATASGSDTVVIAPQPPGILVVTVSCPDTGLTAGKPFDCTVSASGGTPPYTGTGTITRSFAVKGTYTVTATVTDADGASSSGSDTVVIAPQQLVVTVSCPDVGLTAGKPFDCTVSATGGTGPYTGTGTITRSFAVKGTYTVTASVTDANGESASGSDTVVIAPQELVVTVSCPDTGLTAGKPFNCTVSASGGTTPYSGTGTITRSFTVKGTYTVTATVTDANGATASGSDTVVIAPQGLVVDFVFSPDTPRATLDNVAFTATVSGGTSPYTFLWSFGDGGVGSVNPDAHVYASAGDFTVTVTVTDVNDATASASRTITVIPPGENLPPIAQFRVTESPPSQNPPRDDLIIGVGTDINFDPCIAVAGVCTGSFDPDGTIVNYMWDFGDGKGTVKTTSPVEVIHVYNLNGTYTVTLTVTDDSGLQDTESKTLTVRPAPINRFLQFKRNLDPSRTLMQTFNVRVENPNAFAIYVNVQIVGTSDLGGAFALSSGAILMQPGELRTISLSETFSLLDVGSTWLFQMTLTFGFSSDIGTFEMLPAAVRSGSFRIR